MALANYKRLQRKDLDVLYKKLLIEKASLEWDLQVYKHTSQHDIETVVLETNLFLINEDLKIIRLWYVNRGWNLPKTNL